MSSSKKNKKKLPPRACIWIRSVECNKNRVYTKVWENREWQRGDQFHPRPSDLNTSKYILTKDSNNDFMGCPYPEYCEIEPKDVMLKMFNIEFTKDNLTSLAVAKHQVNLRWTTGMVWERVDGLVSVGYKDGDIDIVMGIGKTFEEAFADADRVEALSEELFQ